jgi:hypothetical protein
MPPNLGNLNALGGEFTQLTRQDWKVVISQQQGHQFRGYAFARQRRQ